MSDTQIFDPEGRAIPFAVEGDGPVSLVLIPERGLDGNPLGVVAHYLAEEAGFHIVWSARGSAGTGRVEPSRVGSRPTMQTASTGSSCSASKTSTSRWLRSSRCSSSRVRTTM